MLPNRHNKVEDSKEASLLDIPKDVHVQHIGSDLTDTTIARLATSCTTLNNFFKPVLTRHGAKKLLDAAIACDWETMRTIVESNPELMFELTQSIDHHGVTLKISPVLYALYTRGWYAVNILKSALVTDAQQEKFKLLVDQHFPSPVIISADAQTITEEELEQAQPFMQLFNQWLHDDIEPIDLINFLREQTISLSSQQQCYSMQPVYWAYMAVQAMFNELKTPNPNLVTSQKLVIFIEEVLNYVVLHLLPRETLCQMLASEKEDGSYSWSREADFSDIEPPVYNALVRNCDDENPDQASVPYIRIFDEAHPFNILDQEATIWRGAAKEACMGHALYLPDNMILEINSVIDDFYILRHLANVRHAQLSVLCKPELAHLMKREEKHSPSCTIL